MQQPDTENVKYISKYTFRINKIISFQEEQELLEKWAKETKQEILKIVKICDTCQQDIEHEYGSLLCEQCEQVYDFCLPECQPNQCPFCK